MGFRDLRGLTWVGVLLLSVWLTFIVFVAHSLSGWLEALVVKGLLWVWIPLFVWYVFFLFIGLVLYILMLGGRRR